jgi:hypothetical protein
MAARSEAEKTRERLRTMEREIDREEKDRVELDSSLVRAGVGGIF